jgi:hypothetical protein
MDFDEVKRVLASLEREDLEILTVETGPLKARVISPRMLVRMKSTTVRPKDQMDAAWVREVFGIED